MTTFKNCVNAFGNSSGDSLTNNPTKWSGRGVVPKGKVKIPSGLGDISSGNRRLAKAKVGTGGNTHTFRGTNAFTKGGKKGK